MKCKNDKETGRKGDNQQPTTYTTIRQPIYTNMLKPALVFDERNIPNVEKLSNIGFEYKSMLKS